MAGTISSSTGSGTISSNLGLITGMDIGGTVDKLIALEAKPRDLLKTQTDNLTKIETEAFKQMIATAVSEFKNFKVAATTLRSVVSATVNDWSAICWMDGKFYESRKYPGLEILDRVGGGDSFASGLIYGFLKSGDAQKAVDYGAAHGALAMTTPGDTSMATCKEVEKVMGGGSARVQR